VPKIRCFLPNASSLINGVPFIPCEDGGVESQESLSEEMAAQFDGIQGYALIPDGTPKTARKTKPKED